MKIGLVSHWYDPEPGGAAMPGIHARALARLGHDVHVLTGFPNYPSGRLHSGYRIRPYMQEERDGVTVHRAALYPNHDTRIVGRVANYMSLAASATAAGVFRLPRLDAILVHSTPATIAIPAMVLQKVRREPFVLHVQDIWPQSVVSSSFLSPRMAGRAEATLHRFTDLTYRRAASVAVTSPGMRDLVMQRGLPESRIEFVPNWADESSFYPAVKSQALAAELGINRRFTVMYAGNFGTYQSLDLLIDAANILRSREDVGFALVGSGVQESHLRRRVEALGLENVTLLPAQPFSRMAEVLALGDVQFVGLEDLPLFRATMPSKIQATLAAGRPIIGALAGDAAHVVEASDAGPVVDPGDANALADAIAHVADAPQSTVARLGENARAYYSAHFSEHVNVHRLERLLAAAATGE